MPINLNTLSGSSLVGEIGATGIIAALRITGATDFADFQTRVALL